MNPKPFPAPAHPQPGLGPILSRLVQVYDPELIYLFGSFARGDAGPDSDYDLLVLVPDDAGPKRRRSRLAYEALWPVGRAGDILVATRGQFEARRQVPASLAATIAAEGRIVYER